MVTVRYTVRHNIDDPCLVPCHVHVTDRSKVDVSVLFLQLLVIVLTRKFAVGTSPLFSPYCPHPFTRPVFRSPANAHPYTGPLPGVPPL